MAGAAVRHLSNAIKIEMAMTLHYSRLAQLACEAVMESGWHDAEGVAVRLCHSRSRDEAYFRERRSTTATLAVEEKRRRA